MVLTDLSGEHRAERSIPARRGELVREMTFLRVGNRTIADGIRTAIVAH
jgi:hypothetical protein